MNSENREQTLVLIKPDALQNSLTGYVLSQLSEFHTGLRFAGAKIVHVSRMLAEEHYAEHREKAFFFSLLDYIRGSIHYAGAPARRRVIAFVYQGTDAIQKVRNIAGPTNPHTARDTRPGCIRALGTIAPIKDAEGKVLGERMDNLIHASATAPEAEREIKLWFRPVDIPPSMRIYPVVVSNEHYYFKDNGLHTTYVPGSTCLVAPGEIVWESDYQVLQGKSDICSVQAVAAKYLINSVLEED